ncbi:MAG: DinB family protein [bacterium]|nr:DinB family protein [bacterium]
MNEAKCLREQMYGVNAHLHTVHALEGLAPSAAGERVASAPHTIFQVLHHMVYWQDIALARATGEHVESPATASLGWMTPPAPEDASDWEAAIACLAEGLRSFEGLLAADDVDLDRTVDPVRGTTLRDEILMVQGHNSYHLGQIVMLRQVLGAWPPPRGGDTW